MAIAAAPAIAFGPPGWVVFGLAVAGTAIAGAWVASQSSSRSRTSSSTQTSTSDVCITKCEAKRPWSVRAHAQGTDMGGTSGSTLGAPPLLQISGPISVAQGVGLASETFALLSRRSSENLAGAYEKCVAFIGSHAPYGWLGQRSFYGAKGGNNRFDVDSFGPSPNFIA